MKKKTTRQNIKTFKMILSKSIYILSVAILIVCVVGIALTVYRAFKFGINGFSDILKYPFLIVIELLCIVLVVALLVKSQYVLDDKELKAQYGLVKNVFPVKSITSILLDTDTKKMTIYMGEEFFVLSLPETDNHDFVQALREKNPNIEYSFTLSENK